MARPEKSRKISGPPIMRGFRPYGMHLCKTERVQLLFEEYESLRLVNYEMMSQEDAASQMQISRPTLTRIYNKALKVIARAFIEGKAIEIEGGSYEFESDWFRCRKCHKLIEGIDNHIKCERCNEFNSEELIFLNRE